MSVYIIETLLIEKNKECRIIRIFLKGIMKLICLLSRNKATYLVLN